jgi:hypothetical protein
VQGSELSSDYMDGSGFDGGHDHLPSPAINSPWNGGSHTQPEESHNQVELLVGPSETIFSILAEKRFLALVISLEEWAARVTCSGRILNHLFPNLSLANGLNLMF